MAHENDVNVNLLGTIVDKQPVAINEDYEEWDCLAGVSISINNSEIASSDSWGNFRICNVYDKSKVKNLNIKFKKDKDNEKSIDLPLLEEAHSKKVCLFVKL